MQIQFKFPLGEFARRAKKFHNALNGLIQGIWAQTSAWRPIDGDEQNIQPLINLIPRGIPKEN